MNSTDTPVSPASVSLTYVPGKTLYSRDTTCHKMPWSMRTSMLLIWTQVFYSGGGGREGKRQRQRERWGESFFFASHHSTSRTDSISTLSNKAYHITEIHPEPEKFKMDRFINEDGKFLKADTVFTFGAGRWGCEEGHSRPWCLKFITFPYTHFTLDVWLMLVLFHYLKDRHLMCNRCSVEHSVNTQSINAWNQWKPCRCYMSQITCLDQISFPTAWRV